MGQRLELFTDSETARSIVDISNRFGIDAQISGYVEEAEQKEVVIESPYGQFIYK